MSVEFLPEQPRLKSIAFKPLGSGGDDHPAFRAYFRCKDGTVRVGVWPYNHHAIHNGEGNGGWAYVDTTWCGSLRHEPERFEKYPLENRPVFMDLRVYTIEER